MTQTKAELLQTRHQGDIRLGDADSTNYVGFKAPATVGSNLVWTLPATDGSANQFLQTNASGVLSWGTADTSASMPLAGGTFTGNTIYNDNVKAIFGTASDGVEVFHDGSNSHIKDTGTGNLVLSGSSIQIENAAQSEFIAKFIQDGAVELYHNAVKKFETSAAGVAITGAATISTDLTVTGDLTVSGTTTTINTQTLDVEDKNVVIGKVSSPSDTTADGGGITLKGASDKTINWVNSTDAWTFSEHINIASGKKLGVGGANYGTSGQVLTSGGSSTHPSWTTISSAPQITATADGAITAGKTCIITTAGKAKQVASAPVAINPVTRNSGSEASQSGTGGEYLQGTYAECVAYDPDSDTVAVALREDGNGNAKFYLFSTSGDNLTYHTVERVLDNNSNRSGSMSVTALPGRRFIGTYYDSANSGTTKVVIFTVNANGDGWAAGSTTALKANGCYTDAIFGIHTTGGRVAFSVRGTGTGSVSNGRMALICGDAGTSGSTWTYRSFSDNIFGEPTSYCISLDYDSTNDVIGVQAGNSSLMEIIGMRIAAGTGANITKGTKYTLTTGTVNDSRHICKHVSGTTWVSQWAQGTGGPIYLHTTTINSSLAVSNGAQYTLSGSGNNGGVGLDVTNEGRLLLGWQHNNNVAKVKQYTLSGTTLTALSGEPTILDSITDKDRFAFRYMGHNGKIAAFVTRGTNGLARGTADTTEDGSNMTAENYIGIAASTVSDGAAATIDVSGATNSSQSSLTPGQKYYVQADGTLGLSEAASPTAAVFAGTAIAATKIIVNDQQPVYVAPSGWTVINSGAASSGDTALVISESLSDTYALYRVQFYLRFTSNGSEEGIQIKSGGSWATSNYFYQMFRGRSTEETAQNYTGQSRMFFGAGSQMAVCSGIVEFGNVADTSHYKIFRISVSTNNDFSGIGTQYVDTISAGRASTAAITGIRFNGDSLAAGWFVLEGLAI